MVEIVKSILGLSGPKIMSSHSDDDGFGSNGRAAGGWSMDLMSPESQQVVDGDEPNDAFTVSLENESLSNQLELSGYCAGRADICRAGTKLANQIRVQNEYCNHSADTININTSRILEDRERGIAEVDATDLFEANPMNMNTLSPRVAIKCNNKKCGNAILTQCSFERTMHPEGNYPIYKRSSDKQRIYLPKTSAGGGGAAAAATADDGTVVAAGRDEGYIGLFVLLTCESQFCRKQFQRRPTKNLKILCQCENCVDESNPFGKAHAYEHLGRDYKDGHYQPSSYSQPGDKMPAWPAAAPGRRWRRRQSRTAASRPAVAKGEQNSIDFGSLVDEIRKLEQSKLLEEIKLELLAAVHSCIAKERHCRDPSSGQCSMDDFVKRILEECSEFLNQYPESKLGLVRIWAISKLRGWLEGEDSVLIAKQHTKFLQTTHREYITFLERSMPRKGPERRAAAIYLCWIKGLVDSESSLAKRNQLGETRLMTIAAEGGSAKDIQLLVEAGVDVNACNVGGFSPIYAAAKYGHVECLRKLASLGAAAGGVMPDSVTPLFIAAQNGHADCVEALILLNVDLNPQCQAARSNENFRTGETPLFAAAQRGFVECVAMLLSYGAICSIAREDGETPISVAEKNGHADCLELLRDSSGIGRAPLPPEDEGWPG